MWDSGLPDHELWFKLCTSFKTTQKIILMSFSRNEEIISYASMHEININLFIFMSPFIIQDQSNMSHIKCTFLLFWNKVNVDADLAVLYVLNNKLLLIDSYSRSWLWFLSFKRNYVCMQHLITWIMWSCVWSMRTDFVNF